MTRGFYRSRPILGGIEAAARGALLRDAREQLGVSIDRAARLFKTPVQHLIGLELGVRDFEDARAWDDAPVKLKRAVEAGEVKAS